MRCGLPSSSPKVWPIPGWSRTAAAIAYPIRCVNETFMSRRAAFSASFSWRRRRSSVSTSRRAEAGRGRDREALGHVARERRVAAAQGLRGDHLLGRRGRAGAAAAVAPSPPLRSMWERTSSFTTFPPVPEPLTCSRSMPCAAATRRATGVLGVSLGRWRCRRRGAGGGAAAGRLASVAARRQRRWWAPSSERAPSPAGASPGSISAERLADLDGLVLLGEDLDQLARGRARGPRRRPCRSRPRRSSRPSRPSHPPACAR